MKPIERIECVKQYGENKEDEKPIAMAKFVINFQKIDDELFTFEWQGWPLKYLVPSLQPHSQTGLQYKVDGEYIFVPWHQIKSSSLKETILWDDEE